jgi:thiamine-monophosphate kinase
METILSGGDDYEILCTVPAAQSAEFIAAAQSAGVTATEIGEVTAGQGAPRFIGPDGRPLSLSQTSFSHF